MEIHGDTPGFKPFSSTERCRPGVVEVSATSPQTPRMQSACLSPKNSHKKLMTVPVINGWRMKLSERNESYAAAFQQKPLDIPFLFQRFPMVSHFASQWLKIPHVPTYIISIHSFWQDSFTPKSGMPGPVQLASGRDRAIWAFRVDGTILEDNMIYSSYL